MGFKNVLETNPNSSCFKQLLDNFFVDSTSKRFKLVMQTMHASKRINSFLRIEGVLKEKIKEMLSLTVGPRQGV